MIKRLFLIIFCLCFVMQTVYAGIVKPVFKQLKDTNFDVIYDPMNNNKTKISYLKNLGNFNLILNSNYSLFTKIPDYGANLEINGTF